MADGLTQHVGGRQTGGRGWQGGGRGGCGGGLSTVLSGGWRVWVCEVGLRGLCIFFFSFFFFVCSFFFFFFFFLFFFFLQAKRSGYLHQFWSAPYTAQTDSFV